MKSKVVKKKNGGHVVKDGVYKKKPVFEVHSKALIEAEADYTILFSCGIKKARIISQHIDDLNAWIAKHEDDESED